MSTRHSHNNNNRHHSTKPHQKFVPRSQPPNPNPKLSTSLRASPSDQSHATSGSASRVRQAECGDWISSKAEKGKFVNYLPQDEAIASGLGAEDGGLDPVESQRVVDLLNRELSRLLKMNPREFWREVASDTSLHEFLDSFLKFRSRWYDFPHHGAKGIVAGVIVGELELSNRVFMVLYRISSNKDPGARAADTLSAKDHGVLLQEKKLLDLPKLLDICAIYGHENEDLTTLLVQNALKAQPWMHETMVDVVSHFVSIVQTMYHRCSSSLELLFSLESPDDHVFNWLLSDFMEVMDFINDAISSMDAFTTIHRHVAIFFACPVETSNGNEELLFILMKLHDFLLPSLQRGFRIILSSAGDDKRTKIAVNLQILSVRIAKLGWNLLDTCFLSGEVFEDGLYIPAVAKIYPAQVEDPVIRADVLVQTFREINNLSLQVKETPNLDSFLQKIQKSYNVMGRLESLQNNGWIILEDSQFEYLSGIFLSPPQANHKESQVTGTDTVANKVQMDEDAIILESKISQIKDLFPDYGKGFITACLEVYNQNPEEVIQRILEGTLHGDLQSLPTSTETGPAPKSSSAVGMKDKGKGKLLESPPPPSSSSAPMKNRIEGSSTSSSSSVGRFIRKSKDDVADSDILDARNNQDLARTAAIISQYEYEDEYDDSFDDLGLGGIESAFEEAESLEESNMGNSGDADGGILQNASSSKWGSRKKPLFYVKDGKNYSYKVDGSVAVSNAKEAKLVNQAQSELIHSLGRGGNLPLGAVKKLEEAQELANQSSVSEVEGRENNWGPRGRGRGRRGVGGGGRGRGSLIVEDEGSDATEEVRDNSGNQRGRGRRGGGGRNHHRKDRAINKHFTGLRGF